MRCGQYKTLRLRVFAFVFLMVPGALPGADWQATVAAGFGAYHPLASQTPAGTAEAGIGPRFAVAAAVGRQFGDRFAVEGAYTFQDGDFEIASGGRKTAFDALAHSLHGDLLVYLRRRSAILRPYAVAGAGAKIYRGVEQPASRPLGEFGSFRHGSDIRPLLTFGGGLEWKLRSHWALRLDLRDYATPFPTSVIVPAPGVNFDGRLHSLVTTLGVTLR